MPLASDWDWFKGIKCEKKVPQKVVYEEIDWHALASNKNKMKELLKKDPSVLFKVVDSESNCMCGGTCGMCEYDDVTFFELIIRKKSLSEEDLLELASSVDLD